jgi:hypothetical protein
MGLEKDARDGNHKFPAETPIPFDLLHSQCRARLPLKRGPIGVLLPYSLHVLASGVCYYLATRSPGAGFHSKVPLIFPPHAVLISVLLLVPSRHWWAYTLAAVGGHFPPGRQIGHFYIRCTARLSTPCRTYRRLPEFASLSGLH